jgi:hypothetical protein
VTAAQCARCPQVGALRRGLCNTCYRRDARAGLVVSSRVDPAAAQAHLVALHESGLGNRKIGELTGLETVNVWKIRTGKRKWISSWSRDAILSVPVPERDPELIAHRELCLAGMRDEYVSAQRGYRHRARVKFQRRRQILQKERRDAAARRKVRLERAERERDWWLHGAPAAAPPTTSPVAALSRALRDVRCGDCEQPRCVCVDEIFDDTAWLRALADHDDVLAVPAVQQRWAA